MAQSTPQESSLPVIDMSSPNREETARKVVKAMETVGFAYLDNIQGYNKEVEAELLKASQKFFSLPLEEKLQYSPKIWNDKGKGNLYRGYCPINVAHNSLLEFFLVGEPVPENEKVIDPLHEGTPMPSHDIAFCTIINSHLSCMFDAAMEILRLTALGLGFNEHVFDDRFQPKSLSNVKLLHYPPLDESASQPLFRTDDHTDASFVTLLVTFEYEGLEYFSNTCGTWLKVAPRPGSVILNIGELLSQLSNGRILATRHRVRDTIGKGRFSVPFFLEARADAKFEIPGSPEPIIIYGPWMKKLLGRGFVFQQLKDV